MSGNNDFVPGTEAEPATPVEGIQESADAGVPEDPFAQYGGKQYVDDAYAVAQAINDPKQLPAVVANGLISLGYTPEQAYAAVLHQGATPAAAQAAVEQAQPEADPFDAMNDDDVLTVADARAQFERMLEKRFDSEREQAAGQAAHQQRTAAADAAVTNALEAKGLKPGAKNTVAVITLAQQYVSPDEWDPQRLAQAVNQGYAQWQSIIEEERKNYLGEKAATAEAQPSHLGGSSPAGESQPEPQSVEEAIARARKYLASQA